MRRIIVDLNSRYDPTRNYKQMEFHAALETYKLYGGAMGGGKTAALINEGMQLNIDYPGNFGLLLRKTWPSFRDTTLPQLEKFLALELVTDWNRSEKIITMVKGSKIRYGGKGDRPDDWQKWMSGEYGWIAIDQAEEFTELEYRMLSTRLRLRLPGIKYFFLLSCNPNIGWIKERFIERNYKDHIFIPALPEDNLANLPPGYIERMELILTPKQRAALLRGDWEAVGEPDNIYSYLEIQKACKRHLEASDPMEIGVDVARQGDDETIIIFREGLRIRIYNKAQGHDLMRTCGLIWNCCTERVLPKWKKQIEDLWDPKEKKFPTRVTLRITIKIDADGIGAGVVDRMKEQKREKQEQYKELIFKMLDNEKKDGLNKRDYRLWIKILEIHGAAKARDKVTYKNQRAEIHWGLREIMGDLDLPDDRELQTQLMALKYKTNSAGQIEIIPKEEIKKKLGRSPDLAEAVIYSLASIRETEPGIW